MRAEKRAGKTRRMLWWPECFEKGFSPNTGRVGLHSGAETLLVAGRWPGHPTAAFTEPSPDSRSSWWKCGPVLVPSWWQLRPNEVVKRCIRL